MLILTIDRGRTIIGNRPHPPGRLQAETSTELLEAIARRSGAFPTFKQWCEWVAPRVDVRDPHDHPALLRALVEKDTRYTLEHGLD